MVSQVGGAPSRTQLSGGVTLQQELDDGDHIQAVAANVDYDMRNEVMVMTGNVTINQQRGSLTGQRVVYNLKTGQVESGGDGNGIKVSTKAGGNHTVYKNVAFGCNRGGIDQDITPSAPANYFWRRAMSIYGGSNEIQRNILATNVLRLTA